jgi:hypothetical protein
MTKYIVFMIALTFAAACGSGSSTDTSSGKTIAAGPAGNLTVTLTNSSGVLRKGRQEFTMTFTDASGKTVDVGAAALNFRMAAMGTMAEMNNAATFTTTSTPGVYKGVVDLDMSGEWQAQITYEGPMGKGRANLPITAQ